ncbi:hypothetical protein EJB05_57761 [Eragrostis curvula]|uniref:DUF3615 domain-containing protein n=1 Tax=Eragrostis curvula TaxID=38414 RepID=A0A5J9SDY4_9POAL|nr:hypothetical protein EJB05_57761 [Eragrostis curvula]
MRPSATRTVMGSSATGSGLWKPPARPAAGPVRRQRAGKRRRFQSQSPLVPGRGGSYMNPIIHHALDHYNARHPGGEFNIVRPMGDASIYFKGDLWWHLNFLARSRNSNKVKRFFAEVHYKSYLIDTPVVESCTIIEEQLDQYKTSCAFCSINLGILHPMGFVCGNGVQKPIGPLLMYGKPSTGLRRLPGLLATPGLPDPGTRTTSAEPGMPPWMPSREESIRAWDAIWTSDEMVWADFMRILPSS